MTDRHRLEVADVFRQHGDEYLGQYGASSEQQRVMQNIRNCRTAALGGHVQECDQCGHQKISYNSCRNRHCPKCQGSARARWLEARARELLPVPYFHVVFTLPECLGPLALQNKKVVYGLLFRAMAETLLEVAANPKRLGVQLGFLAVLHTWGQNLMHHPHLHCVVPAGGLSLDGTAWVRGGKKFFLPVRVLSRVFRGKFIAFLKQAYSRGELKFHGQLRSLAQPVTMENLLNRSVKHDWVVYAKRPFGGPAIVLKYLARYTHRVAISNGRLLRLENGQVTFRWKDYAQGSRQGTMTLAATEFIRRFLLHVLPSGFVRIRYYGFLANRVRAQNLERCRQLLGQQRPPEPEPLADAEASGVFSDERCPVCQRGCLRIIEKLQPQRAAQTTAAQANITRTIIPDTS
jgi:putative transposase/transposase-like zinc-binding protein